MVRSSERLIHEGVPLHYACELGAVHFAIHPADGWPGAQAAEPLSPVIALSTSDASCVALRLAQAGVTANGPHDNGFALVVLFRDPDGNHIEVLETTGG